MGKKDVVYYFHPDVGKFHYGEKHPMKPQRLSAMHSLVLNYGLDKYMTVMEPAPCSAIDMQAFHSKEYIDFLQNATPYNKEKYADVMKNFLFIEDCPIFEGMFDFFSICAGGSLEGAQRINRKETDIVVNFSGGLHHAKKSEASGFCYVNDIVLAILELLKRHARVLYCDIDIHTSDALHEAFYLTDRVMTVSFHRYGNMFFPGTGDMWEIGMDRGRYYTVNVPLREGIEDEAYLSIFKPIMTKVMECYKPEAVVLQCGADSLGMDRLGCFNLSIDGHGECVKFIKSFGLPMIVLGGGGYTPRNVARAWCNETAICIDKDDILPAEIPDECEFKEMFGPDYLLKPKLDKRYEDANTQEYLNALKDLIFENLDMLKGAPAVQMQPIPDDFFDWDKVKYKDEIKQEMYEEDRKMRDRDPD
ncbi:Histone deacetylase 3 [Strongyloides ratti]|uniref:Histone deacetylase n=1 Tax=Strongyloides ratti TaxID=34506 RepID=A0A090L4C9_STRRB|nr:Histone deacetylase 3 [Strongyloides ratti]CEF62329.1 Histone deacetylase 3 [Strongyloides ratti]